MLPLARASILAFAAAFAGLAPGAAQAIAFTPFGPQGQGGAVNGQTFTIGAGGALEELDAFVAVNGQDLNGATPGTAAQLSKHALPADLGFAFEAVLDPVDATEVEIRWTLTNVGATPFGAFTFLAFADFEIDETVNTFFNEYAETRGSVAPGFGYEVDEPGYAFGDIFDHLRAGTLDDTNALPIGSPDDVSFAFSVRMEGLAVGGSATFRMLLSEDGASIGSFAIDQLDVDPQSSGTRITASFVPEPGTGLLLAAGLAGLAARSRRRL